LDFMVEFFQGNCSFSCLHNFTEEDQFRAEVEENFRQYFQTLPIKWTDGKEFKNKFKIILTQILTDDNERIDERIFPIAANEVQEVLSDIDFNAKLANKHLGPFQLAIDLTIDGITRTVLLTNYIELTKLSTKESFDDILAQFFDVQMKRRFHNEWNYAINALINAYFNARAEKCIAYLERRLGVSKEFNDRVKAESRTARHNLERVMLEVRLCLLKCKDCELLCTQKDYHKDKHDCGTNHLCEEMCTPCNDGEARCYLEAGHFSAHICKEKRHNCAKPCTVKDCLNVCFYLLGHREEESCRCKKAVHECGKPCLMFDSCGRTCREDVESEHEKHDCGHQACLCRCILCDMPCQSKDHFHNKDPNIEKVSDPDEPNMLVNKHLCGNAHSCRQKCGDEGRCNCTYVTEIKTYQNKFNSLPYNFTSQVPLRLNCRYNIEPGELTHPESHLCSVEVHRCNATCPDCKVFCEMPHDHTDLHSSSNHRNKENCIYLAETPDFEHNSEGLVRRFTAGNQAIIEICHLACVRAGRGHTHPVICRGGVNCLELLMHGKAEHSNRFYNPPGDYDLLRCDAYWSLQGWEAPLKSISPANFDEILKCNFFCSHQDHALESKVFCEDLALHSKSTRNADHMMPQECVHQLNSIYEIVFVIDITYSMDEYIHQVKEAIKQIIKKVYPKQIQYRFGIVAFTDHDSNKGIMEDPFNPTLVYPFDSILAESDAEIAIDFIEGLLFAGGGIKKGEAVMDGLMKAGTLTYDTFSKKIMFLVTDDRPHGNEFGQDSDYPLGCPCLQIYETSWQKILSQLKQYDFDIYQIKLNEEFNIAAEKFRSFYGPAYRTIDLVEAVSNSTFEALSQQIELTVQSTVQKFMELSNLSIFN